LPQQRDELVFVSFPARAPDDQLYAHGLRLAFYDAQGNGVRTAEFAAFLEHHQ
jgi:hypothetical protein